MTFRARVEDIRSLESFLHEYPKQAPIGLLFYGEEETIFSPPGSWRFQLGRFCEPAEK